ncbi:UNVERIFIED_CONTAM: hypothetical protein FKN15_022353 [Acipenser sinensis]
MVQHRALPCTALLVAYRSHSSLGIHPGVCFALPQFTAELYAALGLARQQAQALAVAQAHPIAPALELTPPAPVVAPDVTRWHLPYSAGCLAGRMVYHTGLKERRFHIAIRLVHRKYLCFTLQGSVLSFLGCGSTSP